jgi:hypothetical protein
LILATLAALIKAILPSKSTSFNVANSSSGRNVAASITVVIPFNVFGNVSGNFRSP